MGHPFFVVDGSQSNHRSPFDSLAEGELAQAGIDSSALRTPLRMHAQGELAQGRHFDSSASRTPLRMTPRGEGR